MLIFSSFIFHSWKVLKWKIQSMQRDCLDRIEVDGSNTRQNGSLGFRWGSPAVDWVAIKTYLPWSAGLCRHRHQRNSRQAIFFIEHRGSLDGYIAYIVVVFIITKCVSRRRPRIHRCMRSGGGRSVVVVVEHVSSPYIAEKSWKLIAVVVAYSAYYDF